MIDLVSRWSTLVVVGSEKGEFVTLGHFQNGDGI